VDTDSSSRRQIIQSSRSDVPSAPRAADQAGRCLATTKTGGVCHGTPTGDGFCPAHSPRYNDAQRRVWRQRGAQATNLTKLGQERAAVASTLPPGVELPPTPAETLDWADATKIRLYLQRLALDVAAGRLSVSVAEMLRKLADSTLKVVDVELDMALAKKLTEDEA
jgi:hypothetical protein